MSGASQVASNTMRQTQEALARIQSELAQKRQADEAILAAHAEAVIQAERFRAAKETADRLKAQHFQTEADFAERLRIQRMQDESERARWVDDVQKNTNMQIAILQQQMREKEAERDREREAAKNIQKFQASQLRDLRATSARVQHTTVTPVPDAVSQIKTESGIANFQQDAKSHYAGNVAVKKEKSADKETAAARADALLAAQLQATIQSVNAAKQRTKPATTVPLCEGQENPTQDAYIQEGSSWRIPIRLGPNSEDDDSDSSSDDSDSSFCEPLSDMVVPKATQGGITTMTIRPFVTTSSLDDLDEKASLSERTQAFSNIGLPGRMERQDESRDPLDFLYRLNAAVDRADIRYKKSERCREQHVKRFTHRLADSQLKSILKSQRFKSMDDLEYVLKQQEDDWDDDRQSGSSTKRDFRADNLRQGRLRTKYPGRAYVTQSGDESDSDERHVMFEDETLEISPTQESVESHEAPPENQGLGMTMEELIQHVLKVMENSGWNKPGHVTHQGKARQSNGHPGSPSP
ncbi:hypothetical protein PHMEG_00030582, partial [Phytophthora megakarya]